MRPAVIRCVLVLASFVAFVPASAVDRATATLVPAEGGGVTLTVEAARPVAKAVETLVEQFGYVITYEDPRYANSGDLEDATARVRKDLDRYPPGKAPKVIVPKGGRLVVRSMSSAPSTILDQLVLAQSSTNHGGRFRVQKTQDVYHIIPSNVRDAGGNWANDRSPLDALITFPVADRTAYETIERICAEASTAAGVRVRLGTNFLRSGLVGLTSERYQVGADREPARDVLVRALRIISAHQGQLTWLLFYGNKQTDDWYALNLVPVPQRPQAAVTKQP